MKITRMRRRNFIKDVSSLFAIVVLWPWRKVLSGASENSKDTAAVAPAHQPVDHTSADRVAVVACDNYDPEKVLAAVKKALTDIGYSVPQGIRVLLKPNIIAQNTPDQATTTHPSVIAALCRIFRENNCTVAIGDSSAFFQGGGTLRGMQTAGMTAVAEKYNARIVPFEKTGIRMITTGKTLNPFWITEAVFACDLVVDVPKLKLHQLARYSGAIKNMYGCITGGTKQLYHEQYQNRPDYREFWGGPLTDVYTAAYPGLTVMDAVYGLDKDGPAATGTPRQTGVILASTNGVALDVIACNMVGFDPRWVPAVRVALERSMADEHGIAVIGRVPNIPYVHLPDKKSSKTADYLFHKVIMTPRIHVHRCPKDCTACGKICKPGAISFDAMSRPVIDYHRCIRCYCCAEQCPHGAIELSGGVINHTIRALRKIMKI